MLKKIFDQNKDEKITKTEWLNGFKTMMGKTYVQ